MLNEPEYLDLIVRYLNDPQDEYALSELNSFCAKSPENEYYFMEVERIWNLSSKAAKLNGLDYNGSEIRFKKALKQITNHSLNYLKWLGAVAATILIAGIGFIIYNHQNSPIFLIKATLANQVDSIILADGSKVIMAENTILKYPKTFNDSAREVYLSKGKAFFKITKDPKHPFSITMGLSKVSVLGTSFNLDFNQDKIDLDVKTGRVIFSPYLNGASSILTAGQALSYQIKEREFTTRLSQNADSWLTNELVFVDTPLEDVCKQLSNHYHTNIKLETNQQFVKKLNATFKQNSLDTILEVLKETYGLNIKKTKENIILKTPQ